MVDAKAGTPGSEQASCNHSFIDLMARVRRRDEEAAAELVRFYEPQVRRAVRVRLGDPALRQVVDSLDICQSVLANFFVRTAAGEFDLDEPQQLIALLVTMAQNKIHDWHRNQTAMRRDSRRKLPLSAAEAVPHSMQDGGPADRIAQARELLCEVERRLPNRERRLAKLRQEGYSWAEIATREGQASDALRIGLQRALNRIAEELDVDG